MLVWVFTVMIFSVPDMGEKVQALYVFVMYTLINSVCATFLNGTDAVYMARAIRKNENQVKVLSTNGMIVMAAAIVFSIIMPQLVAGVGATKEGWTTIALMFAVPLGLIGMLHFMGIGVMPISMMINVYLIECMDFGEWKTGKRIEGSLASVTSFASKLGSGLASALTGIVMGLAGYDGRLAVQSDMANFSIAVIYNYLPLILCVVMFVLTMMYNLDKKMPKIREELAQRHK